MSYFILVLRLILVFRNFTFVVKRNLSLLFKLHNTRSVRLISKLNQTSEWFRKQEETYNEKQEARKIGLTYHEATKTAHDLERLRSSARKIISGISIWWPNYLMKSVHGNHI